MSYIHLVSTLTYEGGFLLWVRANDKEIIEKLETQSVNLLKETNALVELVSNFDNIAERKAKIKDLEHEGDRITHELYAWIITIPASAGRRAASLLILGQSLAERFHALIATSFQHGHFADDSVDEHVKRSLAHFAYVARITWRRLICSGIGETLAT